MKICVEKVKRENSDPKIEKVRSESEKCKYREKVVWSGEWNVIKQYQSEERK